MLAGPVLWIITKNKRWMILTLIGVALFVVEVLWIAFQMAG
jgi:hypothetical protein